VPLILAGTKSTDAITARLSFRLIELHLQIEFTHLLSASLVGLNGIVVKSHGGADAAGFSSAIKVAIKEVQAGMIDNIKSYLNPKIQ